MGGLSSDTDLYVVQVSTNGHFLVAMWLTVPPAVFRSYYISGLWTCLFELGLLQTLALLGYMYA